jgi:Polyketide cyclase / dehydrase and lipid transport
MKLWKKLLLSTVGLIALLVLIGFVLPSSASVTRAQIIRAPVNIIHSQIASLQRWPEWTAWTTNRFPDLVYKFEGPDMGMGARMIASGKTSGDGVVTITRSEPSRGIDYMLDFEHGLQVFHGTIALQQIPNAVKVTWTLKTDVGLNPVKRWASLLMGNLMGGDMEISLAKLKSKLEPL